jgi:hypothetical protein
MFVGKGRVLGGSVPAVSHFGKNASGSSPGGEWGLSALTSQEAYHSRPTHHFPPFLPGRHPAGQQMLSITDWAMRVVFCDSRVLTYLRRFLLPWLARIDMAQTRWVLLDGLTVVRESNWYPPRVGVVQKLPFACFGRALSAFSQLTVNYRGSALVKDQVSWRVRFMDHTLLWSLVGTVLGEQKSSALGRNTCDATTSTTLLSQPPSNLIMPCGSGQGGWLMPGPCAGDRAPDATLMCLKSGEATRLHLVTSQGLKHTLLLITGATAAVEPAKPLATSLAAHVHTCVIVLGSRADGPDLGGALPRYTDVDREVEAAYGRGPASFLIRPDGHVALRTRQWDVPAVEDYLRCSPLTPPPHVA